MADYKHPLDEQNAIERRIQLEGPKDPDNFEMPDGRTLSQIKGELLERHKTEFKEEDNLIRQRSRELSLPELSKGEKMVMTSTGNIIDVTEPKKKKEELIQPPGPPATPEPPPPPPSGSSTGTTTPKSPTPGGKVASDGQTT